jgi:hypothetical protein
MLATSAKLSLGRDDTVVLTLIADNTGSWIAAALAPSLIPSLAALLAEAASRRRELEAADPA